MSARWRSHSAAALSGVAFLTVAGHGRGLLTPAQVAAALRPDPSGVRAVDLVTIENSHQVGGGSVLSRRAMSGRSRRPVPRQASRCTWTVPASSTPAR